jgi:hypothetical protein
LGSGRVENGYITKLYEDTIEILNKEELEAECQADFGLQEKEKEAKWTAKGQRFPKKRASWEVYLIYV